MKRGTQACSLHELALRGRLRYAMDDFARLLVIMGDFEVFIEDEFIFRSHAAASGGPSLAHLRLCGILPIAPTCGTASPPVEAVEALSDGWGEAAMPTAQSGG